MSRSLHLIARLAVVLMAVCAPIARASAAEETAEAARAPSAEGIEYFEKHVRPLLVAHCYDCHSAEADVAEGGLRLDARVALLRGGDSGPAIVPGMPDESRLIRAVRYGDPILQMPPDDRLSADQVAVLVEWVRMGAPDPREPVEAATVEAAEPAVVSAEAHRWWAFQPVARHSVPAVQDTAWPRTEIDRFVLAKLEAAGMRPAGAAERRVLIRRATFDLVGLPPTPEEVDAFLADDSPSAFERVVERLLASPHYGERWGRHWLDVVRYADTSGCNADVPMREAYRYRNYVIDSFNRDKPFDEFVREQIAGDLMPAESEDEHYEQIVATGYLAISRRFSSINEEFHLTLDDTLDNLGKAVLGLTVSCARCHDHKFDPIAQADYFALHGIFESTRYSFPGTEIYRHPQDLVPLVDASRVQGELAPYLARMARLDSEIFATYSQVPTLDTGKEKDRVKSHWKKLQAERDELLKTLPEFPKAYAAAEGTPIDSRIHLKGDPTSLGPQAQRGFLQVLGGQKVPADEPGSGRRQLAEWLTDRGNPLTARVMVNRVWLHHFGKGLVRTPDDFGTRGAPPTHAELLDWLTARFIGGGWSIKDLHRLIMRSAAYQMACVERRDYAERDPDNRLLWTFNRRRLEAEAMRDAMLAASGQLDRTRGMEHPFPPEWEWRYTQHKPFVDSYPTLRRTVYVMQSRIRQHDYLALFDGADTNVATGERKVSTTPQQSLDLMNSSFAHEQAAAMAARLESEAATARPRIERAYEILLSRRPTAEETAESLAYLDEVSRALEAGGVSTADRSRAAWTSYLRILLSTNEFCFVD